MSSEKVLRSLVFAFSLSLASVASARRPPALEAAQRRVDVVFATCPESKLQGTAGYRDMLERHASADGGLEQEATPSPWRIEGDHVVLECPGGEIHLGAGYRGVPARLPRQ